MPFTQRLPKSNTRRLVQENNRSERELEKELSRLEKERAATLRELDNETNIFRLNSGTGSPTRNVDHTSPSASPRFSANPNRLRRKSGDATALSHRSRSSSPRAGHTSSDSSPNSSPEAQRRLLTKRPKRSSITEGFPPSVTKSIIISHNDLSNASRRKSVTEYFEVSEPLSRRRSVNMSQIPQIVISAEDAVVGSYQRQLNSPNGHQETGGELIVEAASSESKESLSLPIRRGRSSSVPSLPPSVTYMIKPQLDTSPSVTARPRSSSISVPVIYSHQRDSPRRGSQLNKHTERRSSPRRISSTFGKLINDLTRGIEHFELNERDSRNALLSSEEWERLKMCRYLRMPNQDNN
ncbi:unnamed protein product [Lymnaea stagnalis]|uniref:Uncharacterized protein n=1 Tax=Lymnaea stagnalis TaxID=6523 RepID=A0AAV2HSJ6_LYMST